MGKKREISLEDKIQGRQELRARIASLKKELNAMPTPQSLAAAAREARYRLESFVDQNGEGEGKRIPPNVADIHQDLQAEAATAAKACEDQKVRQEELSTELETLLRRLLDMDLACGKEELIAYQQELLQTEQTVSDLKDKISRLEHAARDAVANVPGLGDLEERREDLLAAVATGQEGADSELAEVETAIASKKTEIASAKENADTLAGRSTAAAAGLRRKLEAAQEHASRLREIVVPSALAGYLTAQAEQAGEEFIKLAEELIEKHRQLLGLGSLLKHSGAEPKDIFRAGWDDFHIPAFHLKAFEGKRHHFDPSLFFTFILSSNERESAQAEVIEMLEASGITL